MPVFSPSFSRVSFFPNPSSLPSARLGVKCGRPVLGSCQVMVPSASAGRKLGRDAGCLLEMERHLIAQQQCQREEVTRAVLSWDFRLVSRLMPELMSSHDVCPLTSRLCWRAVEESS